MMMSPEGIGGDDRAGVYMILRILREAKCHVLFCEDEEIGGQGARKSERSSTRPEVNYLIGLDRHGALPLQRVILKPLSRKIFGGGIDLAEYVALLPERISYHRDKTEDNRF